MPDDVKPEEPFMGLPGSLPQLEHMLVHRGKVRNIYDPSLMYKQPEQRVMLMQELGMSVEDIQKALDGPVTPEKGKDEGDGVPA